jgi:hypothetical protein
MHVILKYHNAGTPSESFHYCEVSSRESRRTFLFKTTRPMLNDRSIFIAEDFEAEVILTGINTEKWIDGTDQVVVNVVPFCKGLGHQLFNHSGWYREETTINGLPHTKVLAAIPDLGNFILDSEKKRRIIRVGRSGFKPGKVWLGFRKNEKSYYMAGLEDINDIWIPRQLMPTPSQ